MLLALISQAVVVAAGVPIAAAMVRPTIHTASRVVAVRVVETAQVLMVVLVVLLVRRVLTAVQPQVETNLYMVVAVEALAVVLVVLAVITQALKWLVLVAVVVFFQVLAVMLVVPHTLVLVVLEAMLEELLEAVADGVHLVDHQATVAAMVVRVPLLAQVAQLSQAHRSH
jgi:hypothetical protein